MLVTAYYSIIEGSSQGKRHHTDSTEAGTRRSRPNRPRAVNIPEPLRAAPAAWTMLKAQIQYAWTFKAAVAKIICDGAQSMRSEDLNSRIVTQSEPLTPHCFHVTHKCHSQGKSSANFPSNSKEHSSSPHSHHYHSHLQYPSHDSHI
jgi:hypothetical protein